MIPSLLPHPNNSTLVNASPITTSPFKKLPDSLCSMIQNFLSVRDIAQNSHLVCRKWQHIGGNDGRLDLSGLNITTLAKIVRDFTVWGPLHSLNLQGCRIPEEGLAFLNKFALKELNLHGTASNDKVLADLFPLGLTTLNLGNCNNLTADGISHIAHRSLTKLTLLNCTELEDDALEYLAHLNITHLNLANCYLITNKGLAFLSNLPLNTLDLASCYKIDSIGLAHLVRLPLIKLDLTDCVGIADDSLAVLAQLINLTALKLTCSWNVTDEGLAFLEQLPLTKLGLLLSFNITNGGIFHLRHLPLKKLNITRSPAITGEGLAYLPCNITKLNLSGCVEITDDDLAPLSSLPLHELDLSGCVNITLNGVMDHILAAPLEKLSLRGCKIDRPSELECYMLTRSFFNQNNLFGKETTFKKAFTHNQLNELIAYYALETS